MKLRPAFKVLARAALAAPAEDTATAPDERISRLDAIASLAVALKFPEEAQAARAACAGFIKADDALVRLEELLEPR